MNFVPSTPFFSESGIYGPNPVFWHGVDALNAALDPWKLAPEGSIYFHTSTSGKVAQPYVKQEAQQQASDWGALGGVGVLSQHVQLADFTDGGSDTGTLVLSQSIPAGAVALRAVLRDLTGFTGDTSAVLLVGDGTDSDRYNTGTPSVFTTADVVDLGAVSGTAVHTEAESVTLTLTSLTDFGAIAAGEFVIKIYYLY